MRRVKRGKHVKHFNWKICAEIGFGEMEGRVRPYENRFRPWLENVMG